MKRLGILPSLFYIWSNKRGRAFKTDYFYSMKPLEIIDDGVAMFQGKEYNYEITGEEQIWSEGNDGQMYEFMVITEVNTDPLMTPSMERDFIEALNFERNG